MSFRTKESYDKEFRKGFRTTFLLLLSINALFWIVIFIFDKNVITTMFEKTTDIITFLFYCLESMIQTKKH